ncbi:hypothetical protein [Polaromonas sp. CG9_12]|nr:hypothetical protein [Polaromonas sp. CG9_12]
MGVGLGVHVNLFNVLTNIIYTDILKSIQTLQAPGCYFPTP